MSDRQPDLFDERGRGDAGAPPERPAGRADPSPETLSDAALVERVADAGTSDVDALCAEVAARSLAAAVPALERLWCRFHGYGVNRPHRQQRAVLETLARIRAPEARAAFKRIVVPPPGVPAALLPVALRAAADAGLILRAAFVAGFLDHDDAAVRRAAFELASRANVPAPPLRQGLADPEAPIRLAAAFALAQQGNAAGRDLLLAELERKPSVETVEALAAIGDDEAIVGLGRFARRHRAFSEVVIALLRDMNSPRADRLAARLEADFAAPGDGAR